MKSTKYNPPRDERPSQPCLVCQAQIRAPYGWHRAGCTCQRSCEQKYVQQAPHPYGGK